MTSIIRPTDFNRNTTDPNRNRWTPGQLRHVIAAVNAAGATTMIETVEGLLQEYQVVDVVPGWNIGYDLIVRHFFTENGVETHQDTRISTFNLGAIIVIESGFADTRHVAIRTYNDEASALVRTAQAAHGKTEGRAWGSWKATPGLRTGSGYATYTPHTGNPAFADRWGTRWSGAVQV